MSSDASTGPGRTRPRAPPAPAPPHPHSPGARKTPWGAARECFSLAASPRCEALLGTQQALCTKTRRISRLGARGAISRSPRNACWLLAEQVLLDKHVSQNAAVPNGSPKPERVSHSALRAADGHLQPRHHLPQQTRGGRKRPDGRLEHAAHHSAAPSQTRQASLINHSALPYRAQPTPVSIGHLSEPAHERKATFRTCRHSHGPQTRAASHLWAHICLMS